MKQAVAGNETPKARELSREQTGHTPGPWSVQQGIPHTVPSDPPSVFADSATMRVATIHGYLGQEKANAHLIAAAPELLQMLRAALPLIDDATQDARTVHGNGSRSDLALTKQAEATRAAIARAEGN